MLADFVFGRSNFALGQDRIRWTAYYVLVGLALIGAAAARFVRTGQRLDDEETHPAGSLRAELILSAVLAVVVARISVWLMLG